jgi:hypothetical protein
MVDDHPRGDSRAAARIRREQQRQQWERAMNPGPREAPSAQDHVSEAFASALGALLDAAARLPVCDRAAKLHASLHRITEAADTAQVREAVRALMRASELALQDDPWTRFHAAAMRMAAAVDGPGNPV